MLTLKKIRTLLKKLENKIISLAALSYVVKLNKRKTLEVAVFLEQQGYLQQWNGHEDHWTIAMRGQVLIHKKFYKLFKPSTMQSHVDELIKRAAIVNAAVKYPDYVVCLKITSEYPIKTSGNGVTIAFALDRKNISVDEYKRAENALRRSSNIRSGNIIEYLSYPHKAIQKLLKSGSRILRVKEFSMKDIQHLAGTVIFEENKTPEGKDDILL
ncbi:hypothetical protein HHL17_07025 [Chitinophaga sp. G-6-1-13]|uniref:Uncharacterized protein n=1 Tax=Chitinophaga fulva TaxID=2728842 RepID=A0A848GGI4_9BACT|nr:hypothetical protein [Chitinophaga fulva]NML36947.1 hypothetical protein [Chitinophaga fulva]